MPLHRILYAGRDLSLLGFLHDRLDDCFIVRCPSGGDARLFLKSRLDYALLLLDEKLPDTRAPAIARFTRSLPHRQRTPIIILTVGEVRYAGGVFFERRDELNLLVRVIKRLVVSHR